MILLRLGERKFTEVLAVVMTPKLLKDYLFLSALLFIVIGIYARQYESNLEKQKLKLSL